MQHTVALLRSLRQTSCRYIACSLHTTAILAITEKKEEKPTFSAKTLVETDEERIRDGKQTYDQFIMRELLSQSHVSTN